ncbi:unnamed protein product [Amoebophrya sp. A120]|nr:unnamed protein product [Amoebophrya sp. A120]|eukprot:GSA120T00003618001.1
MITIRGSLAGRPAPQMVTTTALCRGRYGAPPVGDTVVVPWCSATREASACEGPSRSPSRSSASSSSSSRCSRSAANKGLYSNATPTPRTALDADRSLLAAPSAAVSKLSRRYYKSFSKPPRSTTPRWVKRLLLLSEKLRQPSSTKIDHFSDDPAKSAGAQNQEKHIDRLKQVDVFTEEECYPPDDSSKHVRTIHPLLQSQRTGLLAYKMGMMNLYDEWGQRHVITVAKCDRLRVVQSKTIQSHGYSAVQIGLGYKPVERQRKTELGQFMKAGVGPKDELHEFRVSPDCVLPVGHALSVRHFVPGQWCFLSGISRSRGWQGVMRRWNFSGQMRANHEKQHRAAGSVGAQGDGKIWKGKKKAGHMGPDPRVMNVKIFRIDARRNLLFLKGNAPGKIGSVIKISDARGKTRFKNAHIRLPYPTFVPQTGIEYPVVVDQPVRQYDPFLFPDRPIYQPWD